MKGLELSQKYYESVKSDLFSKVKEIEDCAIGLIGSGSECLGFDDELSQDHDFEPGFCIFVPDETDEQTEFLLKRAYAHLPRSFMGFERSVSRLQQNHGVIRTADFLLAKTGTRDGKLSAYDWIHIPEQSLIELTNGKLFYDGRGELSRIRSELGYLPEDIRLKKLAGKLVTMAQTGGYNYPRSIKRGDFATAALCVHEFVKAAIHVCFLIDKKYMPYYKWCFKALSQCEKSKEISALLEQILSAKPIESRNLIEKVCAETVKTLMSEKLTHCTNIDLSEHAVCVNDKITDASLRNMHILAAI